MAAPVLFPIQFIQHHVGQHRRERPALRYANGRGFNVARHTHAGLQEAIDQSQQIGVQAATFQPVMIDPIKESLQMHIHHPTVAGPDIRLNLAHSLMGRTLRAKYVAAVMKVGLPLRTDDLRDGLQDESVQHRGDA